ncbi:putative BSD domain-containing protein [Cucumis melo var. makuwa]|nr:putative BSD domain-containing protein [Cucumis melo var. makuwa]
MSDAQKEHAFTIERLAPRLAALRIELCPCHMSESYFWKVYFVLLHSRLNKHDAEILSTPQVAAARSMWMQELQKQTKPESYWGDRDTFELKDRSDVLQEDSSPMAFHDTHSGSTLPWTFTSEPSMSSVSSNYETEKYQMESSETQFIDKSVIVEKPLIKNEDKNSTVGSSSKFLARNYEEESDNDWLEEDSELGGCNGTILPLENEEDISFSDLDDDDMVLPAKFKIASKE